MRESIRAQSLRNWKIPRILFADGVTFPVSKWRTEAVSTAELSSLSTPSLIAPTDSKRGSGGLEAQMHRYKTMNRPTGEICGISCEQSSSVSSAKFGGAS